VENNLGCIYELEGNWDKAIESYNKALELDPGLNFTRFNIAKIYQASGRLDEAATQISLSLAQPGRGPTCGKACLVAVMERLKAAKIASAASFYNDLGIELAGYSELKAAVASFRRALELDPKYADACFNLGLAHWNLGQKKEAAFAFRQALRIDPNHLKSKEFLSSIIRKK
jgi:tetratricopeptide (TPR) repeat protein